MTNACIARNAVAKVCGSFSCSIRYLRQHFQAKGNMEYVLRIGRPRVTTPGQDCAIMNTKLGNPFQTAPATAAYTLDTPKKRISVKTLCNRL